MKSNKTIKIIKTRRSNRNFIPNKKLKKQEIDVLKSAFIYAPNWVNGQQVSMILVDNKLKKEKLSEISGNQNHIKDASLFVVLIADYYKHKKIYKKFQLPEIYPEKKLNSIIISTHDAGIIAQNICLAAESINLGSVIVGGIRNNIKIVKKILNLPDYTFPLLGISIGYSKTKNILMPPRLPNSLQIFENEYNKSIPINKTELLKNNKEHLKIKNKTWLNATHDYFEFINTVDDKLVENLKKSKFNLK